MRRAHEGERILAPRRMDAVPVADARERLRLVEDDPVLDAVAQRADDVAGVVGKARGRVALGPAAGILERLRQVPVVQRRERADSRVQRRVGQPLVVVEPFRVRRAAPVRLDPRPGDREPVAAQVELAQQRDVFRIAMVAVAGDVAGVAVVDPARRVREPVPDGFALAVFAARALDLIGRGRGAPQETGRKFRRGLGFVRRLIHGERASRGDRSGHGRSRLQECAPPHGRRYYSRSVSRMNPTTFSRNARPDSSWMYIMCPAPW